MLIELNYLLAFDCQMAGQKKGSLGRGVEGYLYKIIFMLYYMASGEAFRQKVDVCVGST